MIAKKQKETYLQKVELLQKEGQHELSKHRNILDVSQVKQIQAIETVRQRTMKNKLKKIEDDINMESEFLKDQTEQVEHEKLEVL